VAGEFLQSVSNGVLPTRTKLYIPL
jgi:hypothetical protein